MKRIKAVNTVPRPRPDSIYTRDKLYTFYLGNGVIASFSSERKLKAYIVDCEKELNTMLQNCSTLWASLYGEFRAVSFLLDGQKLMELAASFQSCDKSLAWMLKDSMSVNKNHFTFSHFGQILSNLIWICAQLVAYHEGRKYYAQVNKLRALKALFEALKCELPKVGINSPKAAKIISINL